MAIVDTCITLGIVAAAAFYLYRKFSRSKAGGGCGCGSEGGCCSETQGAASGCCGGNAHH